MIDLPDFQPLLSNDFNDFTYLKRPHLAWLLEHGYDQVFHKRKLHLERCTVNHFLDMLVAIFIRQYIPKGCRILEVGGGNSRVLAYYQHEYECWNIDKLEGFGNGPTSLNRNSLPKVTLIRDYIGNFNQGLPDEYFDFVFSLSALELNVDCDDSLYDKIIDDLQRVLKPNQYSLHCLNVVLRPNMDRPSWANPILKRMFQRIDTINRYLPLEDIETRDDVFTLPKQLYDERMTKFTNQSYESFGLMTSCQVLWQK